MPYDPWAGCREARAPIDVPIPVIYAFNASQDPEACSVMVDDPAGSRQATEHLLQLGRSRIAHITGPAHHRTAVEQTRGAGGQARQPGGHGSGSKSNPSETR